MFYFVNNQVCYDQITMSMFSKTTAKNPQEYISLIEEPRRAQIQKIHDFIRQTVPDLPPHLQSGMLGYGSYHYKYKSGQEGDWPIIAVASQKNYISIYVSAYDGRQYVAEKYKDQLPQANIGKSCIRFKKIEDIDWEVLKNIFLEGEQMMKKL